MSRKVRSSWTKSMGLVDPTRKLPNLVSGGQFSGEYQISEWKVEDTTLLPRHPQKPRRPKLVQLVFIKLGQNLAMEIAVDRQCQFLSKRRISE